MAQVEFEYDVTKNNAELTQRYLINYWRWYIVIHSCIYYELNDSVITDAEWDEAAKKLVKITKRTPQIAEECVFAKEFKDFDGSTGYHLPLKNERVLAKARLLIEQRNKECPTKSDTSTLPGQ